MLQLPLCMVFSTTPFNVLEFCDEEKAFFMGTHPGSKSVLMCSVTSVSLTESQWSAGTFCFSALASQLKECILFYYYYFLMCVCVGMGVQINYYICNIGNFASEGNFEIVSAPLVCQKTQLNY